MSKRSKEFPFPFRNDSYAYSNHSARLDPPRTVTVSSRYTEEVTLKRKLLQNNHDRCYRSLPLSLEAQWEVLMRVFKELSTYEPKHFTLEQRGNAYEFTNHLLREVEVFSYRDSSSIELEPLDLVGRHVQEDLIIMGDRHDGLFLEAGQLCFPSNWSLTFVLGMEFKAIHTPVPGITDSGFIEKVERFIRKIRPHSSWERKNWSITISDKLDTPLETYSEWGKLRYAVTEENVGELVNVRVEIQRLYRLPQTNDILFSIHTHLLPVEELVKDESWFKTFYTNIKTLADEIAEYKGIYLYKDQLLHYLEKESSKRKVQL
ncbi:DUF3445 domain-containing protein [Alkalihalobacillus sp. R86527]|uniref:heme-dependent oxidative N-demethylase family protein n=1 Tax=Alkalihalobacillus sp. R86527 TaxID=3093863 RepID=UPI00366FDD80